MLRVQMIGMDNCVGLEYALRSMSNSIEIAYQEPTHSMHEFKLHNPIEPFAFVPGVSSAGKPRPELTNRQRKQRQRKQRQHRNRTSARSRAINRK